MYVLIQSGNEEALHDPTIEVEIDPEQLLTLRKEAKSVTGNVRKLK